MQTHQILTSSPIYFNSSQQVSKPCKTHPHPIMDPRNEDASKPHSTQNGLIGMGLPKPFQQKDQAHPNTNTNIDLQNPITEAVLLEPRRYNAQANYSNDPHLITARQSFQQAHAGIMGPPPRPNPSAVSGASLAAFNERTVYSQLLEGHQNEILRLEEDLAAEKSKSAALQVALTKAEEVAAEAQKGAGADVGPGAKRRKVGGRKTY